MKSDQSPDTASTETRTYTAHDTHVDVVDGRSPVQRVAQSRIFGVRTTRITAGLCVGALATFGVIKLRSGGDDSSLTPSRATPTVAGSDITELQPGNGASDQATIDSRGAAADRFATKWVALYERSGVAVKLIERYRVGTNEETEIAIQRNIVPKPGGVDALVLAASDELRESGLSGSLEPATSGIVRSFPVDVEGGPFRVVGERQASMPSMRVVIGDVEHWYQCVLGGQPALSITEDIGGPDELVPADVVPARTTSAILLDIVFDKPTGLTVDHVDAFTEKYPSPDDTTCVSTTDSRVKGMTVWHPTHPQLFFAADYKVNANGEVTR